MKTKLTILLIFLSGLLYSQKTPIKLLPVKEEMWVSRTYIAPGSNYCQTTNRDSGWFDLLRIPSVLVNMDTSKVAILGYVGDGYIGVDSLCPGSYDDIPRLQQFIIRDYCNDTIIYKGEKRYFALENNYRPWYYNSQTGAVTRTITPSVIDALLQENPNLDSVALAKAPAWTNHSDTGFIYLSPGSGDQYFCDEPQNAADITGKRDFWANITLVMSLPPSYLASISDTTVGFTNTYTFPVYIDVSQVVYYGSHLPQLPICPSTCNSSNPDPNKINVDVNAHVISWDSTGACDFNDLKRYIVETKVGKPEQNYLSRIFPITTETSIVDDDALDARELQRQGKQIPSSIDYTSFNGSKFSYRYVIGNTKSSKITY